MLLTTMLQSDKVLGHLSDMLSFIADVTCSSVSLAHFGEAQGQ